MSKVLAALFPGKVAAAELREPVDASLLFPDEAAFVERAVLKRKQDFTAGRICARHAASLLGIAGFPLLPNEDRSPRWPDTLTGSITHTRGFAGAVVAHRHQFRALGVDAEVIGRVGEALWPQVCTPIEMTWLRSLPPMQQTRAATLIFAAKEAFYKCQFSITQEWLAFQAAAVEVSNIDAIPSAFLIRPLKPMKLLAHTELPLQGMFITDDDLLFAGLALEAS